MYEDHFQDGKIVEFEVEGAKFGYKPTTAGEENDWLNEYMVVDAKGGYTQDMTKLNQCKIRNLKKVPYPKEVIKQMSGIDKDWEIMTQDEKWLLISRLKPSVFSQIIKAINDIDNGKLIEQDQKKH